MIVGGEPMVLPPVSVPFNADVAAVRLVGGMAALSEGVATAVADASGREVRRLAGADRYETAAAIVRDGWSAGAATVVVATGADFPDSLAAGPLAARLDAPVVLVDGTDPERVPDALLVELDPEQVLIAGGATAVAPAVVEEIATVTGVTPTVVAGAERHESAARLAAHGWPQGAEVVYLATSEDFADALAGAAAAAFEGAPMLLTARDHVPAPTADALTALAPERVVVLGGVDAVSQAVVQEVEAMAGVDVERLAGADRFETAAAVVAATWPGAASSAYVATGLAFPDALAGAAAAATGMPPSCSPTRPPFPPRPASCCRSCGSRSYGGGSAAAGPVELAAVASRRAAAAGSAEREDRALARRLGRAAVDEALAARGAPTRASITSTTSTTRSHRRDTSRHLTASPTRAPRRWRSPGRRPPAQLAGSSSSPPTSPVAPPPQPPPPAPPPRPHRPTPHRTAPSRPQSPTTTSTGCSRVSAHRDGSAGLLGDRRGVRTAALLARGVTGEVRDAGAVGVLGLVGPEQRAAAAPAGQEPLDGDLLGRRGPVAMGCHLGALEHDPDREGEPIGDLAPDGVGEVGLRDSACPSLDVGRDRAAAALPLVVVGRRVRCACAVELVGLLRAAVHRHLQRAVQLAA